MLLLCITQLTVHSIQESIVLLYSNVKGKIYGYVLSPYCSTALISNKRSVIVRQLRGKNETITTLSLLNSMGFMMSCAFQWKPIGYK